MPHSVQSKATSGLTEQDIPIEMKFILFTGFVLLLFSCTSISRTTHTTASINGFTSWITGHDADTRQLIPAKGNNALLSEEGKTIVHVKFEVKQYGEVSFPINTKTPVGAEALSADLSASKQLQITYKSNQQVILQLRQTGVHGGVHPHITLPAADHFTTVTILFSEFEGGKTSLDLTDVAKFNFAFLSNNIKAGFAELSIQSFIINGYNP